MGGLASRLVGLLSFTLVSLLQTPKHANYATAHVILLYETCEDIQRRHEVAQEIIEIMISLLLLFN